MVTPSTPNRMTGWVSASLFGLFVLLVSALMLICNSFFCYFLIGFVPLPKDRILSVLVSQLFYFLMPISLTFFQWHLVDRLKRAFT